MNEVLPFRNTVTHKGGEAAACQGARRENIGNGTSALS